MVTLVVMCRLDVIAIINCRPRASALHCATPDRHRPLMRVAQTGYEVKYNDLSNTDTVYAG